MATRARVPIGKILLDRGKITAEQLKEALEAQRSTTQRIGQILVDYGYVSERDVLIAVGQQVGVPVFDAAKMAPDPAVVKTIPAHMMQRHNAFPLRRGGNRLAVAMADPGNIMALDDLRMASGLEVEPVLASQDDIDEMLTGAGLGSNGLVGGSAVKEEEAPAAAAEAKPTKAEEKKDAAKGGGFLGLGGGKKKDAEAEQKANEVRAAEEAAVTKAPSDITGMLSELRRPDQLVSDAKDESVEMAEEAPIIRMVNVLIQNAVKEEASDIHVEASRKTVRVRYRIDGVLYDVMTLPKFTHAPLISRLKIMSEMNIAERRIPQDGRIHIRHNRHDYDMRVNVCPTVHGEKCVMRILVQDNVLIGLSNLGFLPDMQAEILEMIAMPNGMVLTTGPTGSGKTTTLYSMLNQINSPEKHILTVEDPVEYMLEGINQVVVNRKAGMTFPVAMRAFLRQDPDIVMVGEIRDLETAEIAVQAALTGHLVLSTLHTNDAPSTMIRLADMGIEPFLISASVIAVIAQRLGRRLCPSCKVPAHPPVEALMRLGMKEEELQGASFFKPTGCDACNNRGFKGRVGIYEFMRITEDVSEMIVRRAPVSEITQTAIAQGMTTLLRDGLTKVRMGMTTIEEVLRVVRGH